MKNVSITCSDIFQPYFQPLAAWLVKRPGLTLTMVIFSSVILLPLITSAALTPFILLLELINYIATKGMINVAYVVLFQGIALASLTVILFSIALTTVIALGVLYSSYNRFYK
ncbi:hypothetical protein NQ315_007904 [Exocentrus adspersus]|uniref:ABC transmembrane type-1 domain-containing protein n=1 Tax=Exocentrus adspersus TaxID=1586481 RepID=A0AAV8W8L7_9CUCU|nr:hypothetical protein NQ315_007904 [Exocentrus adspersus]